MMDYEAWGKLIYQYLEYRTAWNVIKDVKIPPQKPLSIDIELTSACNINCIMCPRDKTKSNYINKMIALNIIDQCADLKVPSIKLNWRGEPTLYNDITDIIAYAKHKEILEIRLNTNGNTTRVPMLDIVKAGANYISFSIDAATKATYEKIRRGGKFDLVEHNIKQIHEYKKAYGLSLPYIVAQMHLNILNLHEECAFIEKWRPITDHVRISHVMDRGADPQILLKSLKAMGRLPCYDPFRRLVIATDGKVSPCCGDWNQKLIVGDIKKQSIKEIWASKELKEIQDVCITKNYVKKKTCLNCYVKDTYKWEEKIKYSAGNANTISA